MTMHSFLRNPFVNADRLSRLGVQLLLIFSAVLHCAINSKANETQEHQRELFEKSIRPLLSDHCYECHSGTQKKGGLRLDSGMHLIKGGDSGEAVIPGDANASLLMEAVNYESYEMPPDGKLSDDEIELLKQWIDNGAYWPAEERTEQTGEVDFNLQQRKNEHWAWQAVENPAIPQVSKTEWPRQPLDHFILAKLEQAGLQPAAAVDRHALIRRLYFDLIGLPPTLEELQKYSELQAQNWQETLVDDLLSSPHFGERWGRHWLDLVRYAESRGHEFDSTIPGAYHYRDYVIRAFNADLPYDQLIHEHIAGDLLNSPRLNSEKGFNESILGTGFWFLGEWVHSPVDIRKDEADRFDNMIDVMSKTFLGLTVSCARCHDHKFDAISAADYYALTGYLQSSDFQQVRFETQHHNQQIAAQLEALDARVQQQFVSMLEHRKIGKPAVETLSPYTHQTGIVVDYSQIADADFLQHGFAFGNGPLPAGTPILRQTDGQTKLMVNTSTSATNDLFWNELKSTAQSGDRSALANLPRYGRTLRSPTFEVTDGHIACLVEGTGHVVAVVDSHRLIAGPLHGNTIVEITPQSVWATLNLQRYIGHRVHLEFVPALNAQMSVHLITIGMDQSQLQLTEQEWQDRQVPWIKYQQQVDATLNGDLQQLADQWKQERQTLQQQIARHSNVALAMADGTGENDHLLIRGNSSRPGKVIPRQFLVAIAGEQQQPQIQHGSGRLQLAQAITSPDNPLTYRVIVNRLWHHLLGRGIVPTTDDFGVLGQRPTHPELLDHLAIRFQQNGMSIKQMIRYIVLSQTYQMSSQSGSSAILADPKNLLFHHRPLKRLEGEIIRDALLTLSGKLDRTLYGSSIDVYLTPFMQGRGRPGKSGPIDGNGRRSIYLEVRRNFLSPFMLTFDTPVPFSSMGRRTSSNVPAQALILMNDPFVIEQSHLWADRTAAQYATTQDRVAALYQTAFARLPTETELRIATQFIEQQNAQTAWHDLAHGLVNTKEFIFLK